jgi:transcriptional regulator with XRE-family HTH domain
MKASATTPKTDDLHHRLVVRLSGAPDLPDRLAQPNLPAAREAAALFKDCFVEVAEATAGRTATDWRRALFSTYDGLMALRERHFAAAASYLLGAWLDQGVAVDRAATDSGSSRYELAVHVDSEVREAIALEFGAPRPASKPIADPEWLVTFHLAIEQLVAADLGTGRVRVALRSLMVHLALSQDDVGRVFNVAGETVRRWERGQTGIPTVREAEILAADAALRRLLELFRPERLAAAIRRPAELFEGDSAYEWILRGRIAEVADRYENALSYQG